MALVRLEKGLTVTIKAFENFIERAILMSEILKKRVGSLFQETKFIKIQKPTKPQEGRESNEITSLGVFISLSKKRVLDTEAPGYNSPRQI